MLLSTNTDSFDKQILFEQAAKYLKCAVGDLMAEGVSYSGRGDYKVPYAPVDNVIYFCYYGYFKTSVCTDAGNTVWGDGIYFAIPYIDGKGLSVTADPFDYRYGSPVVTINGQCGFWYKACAVYKNNVKTNRPGDATTNVFIYQLCCIKFSRK